MIATVNAWAILDHAKNRWSYFKCLLTNEKLFFYFFFITFLLFLIKRALFSILVVLRLLERESSFYASSTDASIFQSRPWKTEGTLLVRLDRDRFIPRRRRFVSSPIFEREKGGR